MAKIVRLEFGTILKVDKRSGGEYDDWRKIKDVQGLIVVSMSERKHPGKLFVTFLYDDKRGFIHSMKSSIGDDISDDPEKIIIQTKNSVYHFSLEHDLSDTEKAMIFFGSGLHQLVSDVSFDLPIN